MGYIRRDKKVLKLVHPGRHIEVHEEPITAAEVMRRNPRHLIARPDVFEFPWIVVKPESLLLPGNVFFIVPNHTLYNLLKDKERKNQSPNIHDEHQQLQQHNYPLGYCAWMSSKLHTCKQYIKCVFSKKGKVGERKKLGEKLQFFNKMFLPLFFSSPFSQRGSNCQSKTKSPNVEILCKCQGDERFSQVEATTYQDIEVEKKRQDIEIELPKKDVNLEFGSEKQFVLKSCLRRPDSDRKSLNLKVSFDIPIKKQKQQMKLNVFRSKFSG